jgi:hypothetical protein
MFETTEEAVRAMKARDNGDDFKHIDSLGPPSQRLRCVPSVGINLRQN